MTPREELKSIRDQIKALEERERAIYKASLDAPAAEKVCTDWEAELLAEPVGGFIQYPITLSGITYAPGRVFERGRRRGQEPGTWVAVRPCDDEHKGKTFLGVLLGEVATSAGALYHHETGVLEIHVGMHNPAIWVPDLNRVVLGAESWWGVIKGPEGLQQITDADINGIWYVQALKALSEKT